jgi:hypothetical protein
MIDNEIDYNKSQFAHGIMYKNKRPRCPIDEKKCDAGVSLYPRVYDDQGESYSDGVDLGECRYGPFGEHNNKYIPLNCERMYPRTKLWVYDMPEQSDKEILINKLRERGFHDMANERTRTVNPKNERLRDRIMQSNYGSQNIRDTDKNGNIIWRTKDIDELRKKKVSKAKPKRKVVKKRVKKCKCKK